MGRAAIGTPLVSSAGEVAEVEERCGYAKLSGKVRGSLQRCIVYRRVQ